jgi:diguanylate cyclase (GGDEF)-like protein/PAS domain S-box-containing protein
MLDRWFLPHNIPVALCIHFSHDLTLVALSYAVAALAAYTALHLVERVRVAPTVNARRIWLATAGISMGFGIWAMHFIAILAVRIPIAVGYDIGGTLLSAGASMLASCAAFSLVVENINRRLRLAMAGLVLGAGIALMHYIGMAALRVPAHIYYDPWLFALSVAVAVGLSTAALFAIRDVPRLTKDRRLFSRFVAALLMGPGIVCIHYSGMFGTFFYPEAGIPTNEPFLSPSLMAWAIGTVTLLLIGCALIAALFEDQRQKARDFTAALINSLPGYFAMIGQAGDIAFCNDNLATLTGLSTTELQGLDVVSIAVPGDRDLVQNAIHDAFAHGSAEVEFGVANKSGGPLILRCSGRVVVHRGHQYLLAIGIDISETRLAEAHLRESEERFRTIFASVREGIAVYDIDTAACVDANPAICAMLGYTRDEMLGLPVAALSTGVAPHTHDDYLAKLEKAQYDPRVFEWPAKAKDGRRFWAELSVRRVTFGSRNVMLTTARDISGRKEGLEQITYLARYDLLTGLTNRGVFVEALQSAIVRAQRDSRPFAVLYLDLDHFKDINDTLGHPVGDLLLVAVAERLRSIVRAVDTVARFGGDEFAILLVDIEPAVDVALFVGEVADRIVNAFNVSFMLNENEIRSSTTIGVAVHGPDSQDAETMLSHADVALYRAKSDGRGTYRFFTNSMDAEVRARVALGTELRQAIALDQFFLLYQAQVEIDTGRIVGMEALVRWRHPTRGLIGPGQFIPEAERNGLIVPLGNWVLREACRQIKQWVDAGIAPETTSVNLSAVQFKRPHKLESDIEAILEEVGLPAQRLELELTETVLMAASHRHNDLMHRLRAKGHRIAIDDFGSGYSSLDYLCRHPADRIKIAQSFIAGVGVIPANNAVVRAALSLARELGLEVVVEGVETTAQLELLESWGCRIVQGYHFARPLSVADMTALLLVGSISPAHLDSLEIVASV